MLRRTARGLWNPVEPVGRTQVPQLGETVAGAWVKSSFSGTADCVEWSIDGHQVRVRDSKDPSGPVLSFTHSEWDAFRRGMQAGEGSL